MKTLYPNYLCMAASIVLSSSAQLFMKAGMVLLSNASPGSGWMEVITADNIEAVTWVSSGLLCYAFSLFCWMYAISRLELSFAYPMLSLSYVLVYLLAAHWPLLGEELSPIRGAGIATIIFGFYLISRSKSKNLN
jgi:undecaprenyl phosphate-alpha-L-ara4N flippase subunit ArnF